MFSKVMILIWERWQRTRWALIAACMLPLSGRLMYLTGYTTLENAITVTKTFWYLGFVYLTLVLLVGNCESRDLDFSFPKRLFRYPVRTTTLFTIYIGYGVAAVALQALIFMGFEGLFFDPISYSWTHLIWFETVYIVLQMLSWLSWLLGPGARFLCLSPLLTGVYVCSLLFFGGYYNLPMGSNILCLIIILFFGAISFWSVSAHRHGIWISGWQWVDSFFGMLRRRPSKPFSSALHAQIWFESRQTGHLFPLAVLCTIGLLLSWWKFVLGPPSLLSGAVPIAFVITGCAAFISGLLVFGVNHQDHVSGASSFWLRRPMSTRTLAVARQHAMVRSLGCVLAILTVVTLSIVAYDYGYWAAKTHYVYILSPVKWALGYRSPLEAVTMTVLGLYGFLLIYWTLLRLGPTLIVVVLVLNIMAYTLWFIGGDIVALWMWRDLLKALVVGLPLAVLVAFYVARRRNLITTLTLVIAAFVFPVVVVSLWAFPWWFFSSNWLLKGLPNLNQTQIIRLISAATLPFIPVVASPLLIQRLRHR